MTNTCISCKYFNTCGDVERVEPCQGYFNGATTLNAIDHELNAARVHRDSLKEERARLDDVFSGLSEKRRAARIEKNAAEYNALTPTINETLNAIAAIETKTRRVNETIAILNNNKTIFVINNAAPVIIEEFTKYAGRPYGEKTRQKISDAIKTRCGVRAYIDISDYGKRAIDIYSDMIGYCPDARIYSTFDTENNTRTPFLTDDNKINAAAFENMQITTYNANNYVVNIDAYLTERAARRERINAAKKELERAAADYNAFAVLPDDRCNTYFKTDLK